MCSFGSMSLIATTVYPVQKLSAEKEKQPYCQGILSVSEPFASDLPFSCKYMCAALMALALFPSSFLFVSVENIQHFKHNGS